MLLNKTRLWVLYLTAISSIWLLILGLDWSRLMLYSTLNRVEEFGLSKLVKLIASLCVMLFVWFSGRFSFDTKDWRRLRVVISVIFLADIGFYINNNIIGIVLFAGAQLLFIIRHFSGIGSFIKRRDQHMVVGLSGIFIGVALMNLLLLAIIFFPRSDHPMFPFIIGYSFFLCVSVCAGISTRFIKLFPAVNSVLIITGALLLYCGDVMVGLNLILPPGKELIISTSLTWTFYLPAIVLFSLSGLKWNTGKWNYRSV